MHTAEVSMLGHWGAHQMPWTVEGRAVISFRHARHCTAMIMPADRMGTLNAGSALTQL